MDIFSLNHEKTKLISNGAKKGPGSQDDADPSGADAALQNKLIQSLMAAKECGFSPVGIEDMIHKLQKPQIRWEDDFMNIQKKTEGITHKDRNTYNIRSLAAGIVKHKTNGRKFESFWVIDSSGSMDPQKDIAYGISQLQGLKASGYVVFADVEIYWNDMTQIKTFDTKTLSKLKTKGGGGTTFLHFFNEYRDKIKNWRDIALIGIITDGGIGEFFAGLVKPHCRTLWIKTSTMPMKVPPGFGNVYNLRNEKI